MIEKCPRAFRICKFFLKGGDLIADLRSKVAFKAVSSKGIGLDVSGKVIDNLGNEVTRFKSTHLGMGCFYITPKAGLRYKAVVQFEDRKEDTVNIVESLKEGISLSVNNDSLTKAVIKIAANSSYFKKKRVTCIRCFYIRRRW